jgi:hypothetical protein
LLAKRMLGFWSIWRRASLQVTIRFFLFFLQGASLVCCFCSIWYTLVSLENYTMWGNLYGLQNRCLQVLIYETWMHPIHVIVYV